MNTLLLLSAVMGQVVVDPASVVVFGRDRWYQTVRGDEETFTGVLEKIPGAGQNSRTFFTLVMAQDGRNTTREVFIGPDNTPLLPYAGRRVRLTGMAVDLKVDGRMKYEIWPARLEVVGAGVPVGVGGVIGGGGGLIVTSTDWQVSIGPGAVPLIGTGQLQQVARSQAELLQVMGGKQQSVDNLLRALNVKGVDFRRNMLVFVSGGICRGPGHVVEITGIDQVNLTYVVHWALRSPPLNPANANLSHPAKVLIVTRTEGPVRFDPPAIRR